MRGVLLGGPRVKLGATVSVNEKFYPGAALTGSRAHGQGAAAAAAQPTPLAPLAHDEPRR